MAPTFLFDLPPTQIELTGENLGSMIDANIADEIQGI